MNRPKCYFGIEIGGTKLQIIAADELLKIHERLRFSVERGLGAAGIRKQIEQALSALRQRWQPLAVGIGFGGPVDWKTGRTRCSHHIAGWSEFELGPWVSQLAEAPVTVDNDANM